jgi:trehalose 6-phosphate phosphatase
LNPLFSKKGKLALFKQLKSPNVFGFDLDGTLIPVRRHFEKVGIPNQTRKLLEILANKEKITIISGRSVKDLRRILKPVTNLKKITLIGNHGLENPTSSKTKTPLADNSVSLWKKELLAKVGNIPGVIIEDKKLSITAHYRLTKNREDSRIKILKVIKALKIKPRIILGEFVFNLIPNKGVNKGSAFKEYMLENKCNHSFYIGDDWTDEDVFRVTNKKIFTVRVKPLKTSKAKFYITKQSGINLVLRALIHGM